MTRHAVLTWALRIIFCCNGKFIFQFWTREFSDLRTFDAIHSLHTKWLILSTMENFKQFRSIWNFTRHTTHCELCSCDHTNISESSFATLVCNLRAFCTVRITRISLSTWPVPLRQTLPNDYHQLIWLMRIVRALSSLPINSIIIFRRRRHAISAHRRWKSRLFCRRAPLFPSADLSPVCVRWRENRIN